MCSHSEGYFQGENVLSRFALAAILAAAVVGVPAAAQKQAHGVADVAPAPAPTPAPAPAQPASLIPSPEGLTMPKLDFTPTPEAEAGFDKYFYFHRENTTYAEAYADIHECDALASGSSIYLGGDSGAMAGATAQYGLGGAIGGAIGSAAADAIFGSAARRAQRRENLRNCMGFKQYQRFGLSRDLWTEFNFEEGLGRKKEDRRNDALSLQALVASGPKPVTKELGL
jgi:hypothetical protein